MQPDQIASARLAEVSRVWTSDLSVSEFALLDAAGFEPLEFVMGSSVFHIGWQQQQLRQSTELELLTQAMYTARANAMGRMAAEAAQVRADGVIGVRLSFRQHGLSPEHIEFNQRLQGSPIRRIGHERWLRNIAVSLGNAPPSAAVNQALQSRAGHSSALVREHVAWAMAQHVR